VKSLAQASPDCILHVSLNIDHQLSFSPLHVKRLRGFSTLLGGFGIWLYIIQRIKVAGDLVHSCARPVCIKASVADKLV